MSKSPYVLSIVIPAYNAGKWIKETLDSINRQNVNFPLEIRIVNDGSSDNTHEQIQSWDQNVSDKCFDLSYTELPQNKGVSYCRNLGVQESQGQWILFMDADDVLYENCLNPLMLHSDLNASWDLVFSPTTLIPTPETTIFKGPLFENRDFTGHELYAFYRPHPNLGNTVDVCLAILFQKTFLQNFHIEFTEGMSFLEDGAFIAKAFSVAKKCGLQWHPFYQLRLHHESTSHQNKIYDYPALEGHFKGIQSLKTFNLKYHNSENDAFLQGLIIKYSLLPYQSAISTKGIDLKKHRWIHEKMCTLGFYPINTNSRNIYLVTLAKWLNISPFYYYFRWWLKLVRIAIQVKIKNLMS
jgi:glycosyltransferase involved in cell wall biosynthesis